MTTLTRNGITVHVIEPLCSRVLRKLALHLATIPAPSCWLY